jgi:hypothetical protein
MRGPSVERINPSLTPHAARKSSMNRAGFLGSGLLGISSRLCTAGCMACILTLIRVSGSADQQIRPGTMLAQV